MAQQLQTLIGTAIDAAFDAGRCILEVYGRGFVVQEKADRSPLTEADLKAHAAIAECLAGTGLPMLSEEGRDVPIEERQGWDMYWLVDPLDGTKEFVKRNGEFTVNIALMGRDDLPGGPLGNAGPLGGVLYAPVTDQLYFAWNGGGAWRQELAATKPAGSAYERTLMSTRLPVEHAREAYTVVASRSHASPETEAFIERMRSLHGDIALTTMGSALKIALVAEGLADVYPRYAPTMEWDTAAGHAIAMEAGREVLDLTTNTRLRYNKNELVNPWFIVQ